MRLSDSISRIVTQHRGKVWLGVAALAAACVVILITRIQLDSDVLNMLPSQFSSVEGLKIYDRDFAQTRELTFALVSKPDDVEKLEEFAPIFAENLRKQSWCERVLSGSPMETPEGIRDLQSLAVPLLLNLEPAAFDQTMSILQPAKMRERLHRMRQQLEAGSPRPQFELTFDSLGVIAPALKPFAESAAIENDQPLTSPDGTMRIFLVVTNQPTLGAFDCQRLMRKVNAFRAQARDGWDPESGSGLDVLVTGRAAYVSEISLSMRHDIVATLASSVLLVGIIFFIGFQRWMPLVGMGFSLLLSCLVGLALGLLIFQRLNMVTVGFCSILIGLGVDFAMLIFGRYQQARNDGEDHQQAVSTSVFNLGRAVFFGALTTAAGFIALLLSGSRGFSQFGVLIAIGILFAGLFMTTVLFLFVRARQTPLRSDLLFDLAKRYVRFAVRRPIAIMVSAGVLLSILSAIAISPVPPLPFNADTRSLEPRNSKAGHALQVIMSKMPTRWEPVLAIVRAHDAQELHDDWQKLAKHWGELQAAGKIKSFSAPAALALSPNTMRRNREQLRQIDFDSVQHNFEQALDADGFSREEFAAGFKLVADLKAISDPSISLPDWRTRLPKSSSWWFLVDRYFAQDPLLTTGFVTSNAPITTHEQHEDLGRELPVSDVPTILSGWSYTLANLLPWSQFQLFNLSALMLLFNAVLLALLYRDWKLWLIQFATLFFAIGAMIASLKIFHVPLNLLNVLAFPLVLAIGVDYGIYVLIIWQRARQLEHDVAGVIKPVVLAGLTAISGFGSLGWARNPSLSGLGITCAIGIFWSLAATIFFTLPAAAAAEPKVWREQ